MVAMNVWPTDAGDGSVSNEARWRKMARFWMPSGVILGVGGSMAPSLAFPNLTVQAGAAWVDGHYAELLGSQVLTVTANGLVVVRFDPAANTAELLYRDGVTLPTQNVGGVWEITIASMSGSVMTDRRTSAFDSSGVELYHLPITTPISVTATTAAGAQGVHNPGARYYDGSPIIVEFFASQVQAPGVSGGQILINLWETNTDLGYMAQVLGTTPTVGVPVLARRRIVPPVGMANYNTRVWVSPSGTGKIDAGPGLAAGSQSPCYLRFTRA